MKNDDFDFVFGGLFNFFKLKMVENVEVKVK